MLAHFGLLKVLQGLLQICLTLPKASADNLSSYFTEKSKAKNSLSFSSSFSHKHILTTHHISFRMVSRLKGCSSPCSESAFPPGPKLSSVASPPLKFLFPSFISVSVRVHSGDRIQTGTGTEGF